MPVRAWSQPERTKHPENVAARPRLESHPHADVAQLVEHFTRNEGVRGSNPRVGLDPSFPFRGEIERRDRAGFARKRDVEVEFRLYRRCAVRAHLPDRLERRGAMGARL